MYSTSSEGLAIEIKIYLFAPLIENAQFFSVLHPRSVVALLQSFQEEIFSPGDFVMAHGQVGREMYFISRGRCSVHIPVDRYPDLAVGVSPWRREFLVTAEGKKAPLSPSERAKQKKKMIHIPVIAATIISHKKQELERIISTEDLALKAEAQALAAEEPSEDRSSPRGGDPPIINAQPRSPGEDPPLINPQRRASRQSDDGGELLPPLFPVTSSASAMDAGTISQRRGSQTCIRDSMQAAWHEQERRASLQSMNSMLELLGAASSSSEEGEDVEHEEQEPQRRYVLHVATEMCPV